MRRVENGIFGTNGIFHERVVTNRELLLDGSMSALIKSCPTSAFPHTPLSVEFFFPFSYRPKA